MELSKLNISSIAKEEIRRRFFDSQSLKNKTSSDSLDTLHKQPDQDLKTSKKDIQEKEVENVIPETEGETSAYVDDGFPLITSVFSLALPSSGATDQGCVSTDEAGVSSNRKINAAEASQSKACTTVPLSDVSSCNQGNLPFVVKCSPNGVITVCSPPNRSSSFCKFGEEQKDATTMTSSLKGSLCSTESSDMTTVRADQHLFPDNTAVTTTGLIPNMVTFIEATQPRVIPAENPGSEVKNSRNEIPNNGDAVCPQEIQVEHSQAVDTNLIESVKTSSLTVIAANEQTSLSLTKSGDTNKEENNKVIDSDTPYDTLNHDIPTHELSIEEEYIDQLVPTKQEEKIRHLKDLLRRKEVELEKFRFKGKVGSDSAVAQLRANFLKKNPSLYRRSLRGNTSKIIESNSQISTEFSSNINNEKSKCDKKELTSKMKVSDNADVNISNSSSKQKSTKFTDEEKYKLVNVTILQGHTRTLAVPRNEENTAPLSVTTNVQTKPSLIGKATETVTRKRKQQMPRKIGSGPSKRKSNSEEDQAIGTNSVPDKFTTPVQILTADSSISNFKSCPTGPTTRSSPRRKKGHQSLQNTTLKRKLSTTNELDVQNGSSEPEKLPKGKSYSPMNSKARLAFTKPKEICASNVTTTSNSDITINLKDSKQVTTSSGTSGQKVAYVLHVNGAGATTNKKPNLQSSNVSNEDIVKRVVESMSKEVFDLVSKVPGDDTESKEISKLNNSPVTSSLPGSNVILHRNPVAIANQSETTPSNCTSVANISDTPPSCKVPVPTPGIPLVNVKHNKIQTEVAKVGILKLDIPVCTMMNNQTVSGTRTSQLTQQLPISSRQNKQVVQNLQSDTTISSQLVTPLVSQPKTCENTILPGTGGGTSVITSPNVSIPVSLGAVTMATANLSVSTRAPEVKSVPSILGVRNLTLNPNYTLTVPFAIASGITNTNNVPSSPTKHMANTNQTSRPIVPKLTSSPNTSHRLLAPKPTSVLCTLPTLISPKPTETQNIKPLTESSNSTTPLNTSSPFVAAKPTSTQYKLPQNVVLASQNIAARPATSSQLNQVINILPKPVMTVPTSSSTLPENLNNGNILVYDVVQSNLAQVGQSTPTLASKDAAKLVVYVSNTGDTRNLGIIKDKKIYLNSNQVTTVTQPKLQSPVTTISSEFIPNPQDGDFKVLLGLEHVVKLLTND